MRPPDPRSQRPGRQGRRQAKERTHHLDNPELTPEQTPTSKETPVASTSNSPATNGPATNGGNGGTATATATRREAPPAAATRKYYTITELIVSPPKAGKTQLLKDIANGISGNHSDVHIMVVLVGERPEEVTDIRRSIKGEVFSSTFDEPTENHTRVAELALERAKRLVETGRDVVILLDSITRLARAYNLAVPPSGRTLSGGMDPVALYPPKRFFGAARNVEGGGSLSIFATCLVDTGSRMDDVIYEEFKGTGNSEMILDRKLQERRTFPAINIPASGTRREELLLTPETMRQVILLRKMLSAVGQIEGTELLLQRLGKTKTNKDFLSAIAKSMEADKS